jgi:hypothetical protein
MGAAVLIVAMVRPPYISIERDGEVIFFSS